MYLRLNPLIDVFTSYVCSHDISIVEISSGGRLRIGSFNLFEFSHDQEEDYRADYSEACQTKKCSSVLAKPALCV